MISISAILRHTCTANPAGKISWIPRGNLQGLCLFRDGIHAETQVVSETQIHMEKAGENFEIAVKMRGKFPQNCKHINSPNNDIKSSLGFST